VATFVSNVFLTKVKGYNPSMKKLLMSPPTFFRITNSINPHMTNKDGDKNIVIQSLANEQWNKLKETIQNIGIEVIELKPKKNLPDLVFTANHCLQISEKEIVLSKMAHAQRGPEIKYVKEFYSSIGLKVHEIDFDKFEGMGDSIWYPQEKKLWAGYGFRSSLDSYKKIESKFNIPFTPLKLINSFFYHLDTCFFIINANTACYVREAFDHDSVRKLEDAFKDLIRIDYNEALLNFAGNAYCPDGKNVLIQKGSNKLKRKLQERGLNVIELSTSEFIKAGGSCFCMKMELQLPD
jgi:N-dimethylarginine dimethylaminohydrolase